MSIVVKLYILIMCNILYAKYTLINLLQQISTNDTYTHTYSKDLFKKGETEIWNYKVKRIGNPVENKW